MPVSRFEAQAHHLVMLRDARAGLRRNPRKLRREGQRIDDAGATIKPAAQIAARACHCRDAGGVEQCGISASFAPLTITLFRCLQRGFRMCGLNPSIAHERNRQHLVAYRVEHGIRR